MKIEYIIKSGGENGSWNPQQPIYLFRQGAKTGKAKALSDDCKNKELLAIARVFYFYIEGRKNEKVLFYI